MTFADAVYRCLSCFAEPEEQSTMIARLKILERRASSLTPSPRKQAPQQRASPTSVEELHGSSLLRRAGRRLINVFRVGATHLDPERTRRHLNSRALRLALRPHLPLLCLLYTSPSPRD